MSGLLDRLRGFVPLTGTGVVVLAAGLGFWVLGWQLGWVEASIVAAGCLLAVLVAVPFVVGRLRLDVTRELEPVRVMEDEPALAVLIVTNTTARSISPRTVEDTVDERRLQVEVGALQPGESMESVYNLPTDRRGRHVIGPAMIVKADPLGLLRREVVQTRQDILWVHPRHRVVASLPVGFAKDLEGPTSDASPAGDVAFHALREYQVGDDYRHIHWLSTARAGEVMVRHYVDNRRPHLGVVLDERLAAWGDPDRYELGVRVAASLSVSSLLHQQPVCTLHGAETLLGTNHPGTAEDVLDRLTEVRAGAGVTVSDAVGHLRRTELQVSAAVLIVGPGVEHDDLLSAVQGARRLGRVIVVRVDADDPLAVSGAKVLEVASLEELVTAWNRMVR